MDILQAREIRGKHVSELMELHKYKTIAILKLNVVGKNKNPINMRFICLFFDNLIHQEFQGKIIESMKVRSDDGDYIYYVINEEGNLVKQRTIFIEDEHYLGRLIDIDIYNETSISRSDMSCEMRKCLICDNYAHICSRNQTHSQKDINRVVSELIENHLTDIILNEVMHTIYEELELYPKFGLVSQVDNGCHKDMDFELFVRSSFVLKPYLREYIQYGIEKFDNPIELQKIGIRAENGMFKATSNVNTQKGLIFALGLFLPALTKAIINNRDTDYIIQEIQRSASSIIGDYYRNVEFKENKSHGDMIYLDYGVKGIRGEALKGFKKVFDIPSFRNVGYEYRNHEYLVHIMAYLTDTTIVHKKGFKTLKRVQSDMDDIIKAGGYAKNNIRVKQLSDQYKDEGISPGGASDLLVVKMVYEKLRYLLCVDDQCGI